MLRPKDTITFTSSRNSLVVKISKEQVQVNSSMPAERSPQSTIDARPSSKTRSGVPDEVRPHNDQVMVSRSAQEASASAMVSTPSLLVEESNLVEETPTSRRVQPSIARRVSSANLLHKESFVAESVLAGTAANGAANLFVDQHNSSLHTTAGSTAEQESDDGMRNEGRVRSSSLNLDDVPTVQSVDEDEAGERLFDDSSLQFERNTLKLPLVKNLTESDVESQQRKRRSLLDDLVRASKGRSSSVAPIIDAPVEDDVEDDADTDSGENRQDEGARHLERIKQTLKRGRKRSRSRDEKENGLYTGSKARPKKQAKRTNEESQDSLNGEIVVVSGRQSLSATKTPARLRQSISVEIPDIGKGSKAPTPRTAAKSSSTASSFSKDAVEYDGPAPVVVFSNSTIPQRAGLMKFFRNQGGSVVDAVSDSCNFLCVGAGELKKTGKLLLSVALGKRVVTDKWIIESAKVKYLLDPTPFLPQDSTHEKEWGFSLSEAVGKGRRQLLAGTALYFTPALRKEYGQGFAEIESVARASGCQKIISKPARDIENTECVILALEHGDNDAVTLLEKGRSCYSKDLLSIGVLRGRLDLDGEEFRIVASTSQAKKAAKKRKG